MEEREYQRKLAEAQELARKIKEGDLFNEDQILLSQIREPDNVCTLTANYIAVDFGPSPDFRGDGLAALFNDTSGVVYYYDLMTKQRYKLFQLGQDPSFGAFRPDGEQKFVFQEYELRIGEEGTEIHILGLLMNTETDWLKPPKQIYQGPASEPFLVNDDQNVIFKEADAFYKLDGELNKHEITEEEYKQLRDSRYILDNRWKVVREYKGLKGLWITDPAEINWVQIRDTKDLKTIKIMPAHYAVYCWSNEFTGLLEILPSDVPNFSIRLQDGQSAAVGDLFDVFEKKLSPISQEVIGYDQNKYKGSLRVIKIVDDILICEFQTKLYLTGIFKDDAAVSQKNSSVTGSIL
ncbi:MAG TPA: hypothetical protein PLV45_01085 [bacterium]|nr:hypothetical protein [bacterium]